jgi:hypothetical protein
MNQQRKLKMIIITVMILFFTSNIVMAQIPPEGKYNTTNYPEDRKAIDIVSNMKMDTSQFLNDDMIAVGPDGRVSFGFEEWKKGFADNGLTFKSVTPRPGTSILRVYNGDAAVKNVVFDVVFDSPGGDLFITVIRTETYIKQNGKWYFVSGQGTKLLTKEEMEGMRKKQ